MLDAEAVESVCWYLRGRFSLTGKPLDREFISERLNAAKHLCGGDVSPHRECAALFFSFGRYAKRLGNLWTLLPMALADATAITSGSFLDLDGTDALRFLVRIARGDLEFDELAAEFASRVRGS